MPRVEAPKDPDAFESYQECRVPHDIQAFLKDREKEAHIRAEAAANEPLIHACLGVFGLLTVQLVRIAAWKVGSGPVNRTLWLHFLSIFSDLGASLCGMLLLLYRTPEGHFLPAGYVAPCLVTLAVLLVLDVLTTVAVACLQPWAANAFSSLWFMIQFLEVVFGPWNCSLVASVSLQSSLWASCWRFYTILLKQGLDAVSLSQGALMPTDVTPLMLCFEDKDLEGCDTCCQAEKHQPVEHSRSCAEAVQPYMIPQTVVQDQFKELSEMEMWSLEHMSMFESGFTNIADEGTQPINSSSQKACKYGFTNMVDEGTLQINPSRQKA